MSAALVESTTPAPPAPPPSGLKTQVTQILKKKTTTSLAKSQAIAKHKQPKEEKTKPPHRNHAIHVMGQESLKGKFPDQVKLLYFHEKKRHVTVAYKLDKDKKQVGYGASLHREGSGFRPWNRKEARRIALERHVQRPVILDGRLPINRRLGETPEDFAKRQDEKNAQYQEEWQQVFVDKPDDSKASMATLKKHLRRAVHHYGPVGSPQPREPSSNLHCNEEVVVDAANI